MCAGRRHAGSRFNGTSGLPFEHFDCSSGDCCVRLESNVSAAPGTVNLLRMWQIHLDCWAWSTMRFDLTPSIRSITQLEYQLEYFPANSRCIVTLIHCGIPTFYSREFRSTERAISHYSILSRPGQGEFHLGKGHTIQGYR